MHRRVKGHHPSAIPGENLFILAHSGYLSGRNGDGFDKRGYSVRGDLSVAQYEFSRHGSLRSEFFKMGLRKAERGSALPALFVSCQGGWNYIFGKLRGWQTMDHGVGVFDPDAIGSEMGSHDVHDCVVGSLLSPIALPFEHDLH